MRRARHLAHRVVDVVPERMSALVAVEQRREDPERERGGDEQRVALKRGDDLIADLSRGGVIVGQLQVVLDPRRLVAGRDAAVDPARAVEPLARARERLAGQHVGNVQQHGFGA